MITNQISVIDNTKRVAINNVPSGQIGQVPMLLLEIAQAPTPQGRQLGGGLIFSPKVHAHIIAENRYDKDELIDFLQTRTHMSVRMIDWDLAPAQFTYEGDFATTWDTIGNLASNYQGPKLWFKSVSVIDNDDIAEDGYYTALVAMELEIHTNEVF